jgi:hypothetical protein
VKFSCERCGKKYATAETPAPGRVYKIKCKACGHLIVVKASAGGPATASTEMRPPSLPGIPAVDPASLSPRPEPHPAATPEIQLAIEPLAPARTPGLSGPPLVSEGTQEISVHAASAEIEARPPAADPGYVDLFADPTKSEPLKPADDPFLAAARASLPDGYGASAADPLGALRDELNAAALAQERTPSPPPPPPPPVHAPPAAVPKIPVIPKPPQQKNMMPVILIGAGSAVLVGILAFVLLSGSPEPAPPQQRGLAQVPPPAPAPAAHPPAAAPAPPAPPPVAAAPSPSAPPAAPAARPAAPAKPPEEDRRAREDRREREREREREAREAREAKEAREREAREAREIREREARESRERDKAARDARAREEREQRERDRLAREQRLRDEREQRERDAREARERREAEKVAAASAEQEEEEEGGGLGQDQIQKVLSSTRRAFESCILTSGRSGEIKLDGRRVMLRLNIQTSGAVTYPTLDDVTLNGTELGQCLKGAARVMQFPKFKGDTMHIEVPLVLTGG